MLNESLFFSDIEPKSMENIFFFQSSISDRLPRLEIDHEDNKNDVLKYAETLVDNKSFTKAPAVIIKQEDTVREAQMAHVLLAKKIKQEAQDSEPDDFSREIEF